MLELNESYQSSCEPRFLHELARRADMEVLTSQGQIELEEIEILLRLAAKNRILYCVSKELMSLKEIEERMNLRKVLEKIIQEGDKNLMQQVLTIDTLKTTLSDIVPFLVIKTYKGFPHVVDDIDILVSGDQYRNAIELMRMNKFKVMKSPEPNKFDCLKSGLLRVSLHQSISWHNIKCVDDEFLWREARHVSQKGVEYTIPRCEGDLLSLFGHIIFETHNITLGDVSYFEYLTKSSIDWKLIREQAEKHGWSRSFERLLNVAKSLCIEGHVPYMCSLNLIFESFLEVTLTQRSSIGYTSYLRNIFEHSYRLAFKSGLPKEIRYLDSFLS